MAVDSDRIARLEAEMAATMRELTRHVDDCMRDRQETRETLVQGQQARELQHTENGKRLGKIENRLAWLAGLGTAALFAGQVVAKLVLR